MNELACSPALGQAKKKPAPDRLVGDLRMYRLHSTLSFPNCVHAYDTQEGNRDRLCFAVTGVTLQDESCVWGRLAQGAEAGNIPIMSVNHDGASLPVGSRQILGKNGGLCYA